ncbi:hypothetical protein INT47_002484 [Mucor saturninus]|uniref:Uncharacterized protein n=1 Tax=Mucor saturninus TaxID=64648 RepID=A0A8H7RGG5_9FUNG|nr:hypothetical protein INT47_002484 [Mucor saturninus]
MYSQYASNTTLTFKATIHSINGERDALQLKVTELEANLKKEQELHKDHFETTTRQLKEKEDIEKEKKKLEEALKTMTVNYLTLGKMIRHASTVVIRGVD